MWVVLLLLTVDADQDRLNFIHAILIKAVRCVVCNISDSLLSISIIMRANCVHAIIADSVPSIYDYDGDCEHWMMWLIRQRRIFSICVLHNDW